MQRRLITTWRIIHTGIVNFMRNVTLAVAAMAVMVVTLTIVLFSLITNATFVNTINDITDKISVSAYLQDTTTEAQAKTLVKELEQRPEVKRVVYLSKQQALQSYISQNKNNPNLITAATEAGNPIPATIQIYPRDLNEINSIKEVLVVESAVYGILSAVISVLIVNSAFIASSNALQASSLGLLDINYANQYFDAHFWQLLTLQIAIGIVIGTVSSVIATHRYLKFKTK
jgi:cell division protein FtsX